jgi:hypothetical protein
MSKKGLLDEEKEVIISVPLKGYYYLTKWGFIPCSLLIAKM